MPAVSKAQQQAAGIAHAVEKGELPKSKLRGASKQMFQMKSGDLKKFAKTKRKGLPKHVEGGPVTARALFLAERDDAPKLGLGKTGLKFARMTSKQAFKPAKGGQSDSKWATSAKLRAELAHEKPGGQMKSMDKVGKVPHAFKEAVSPVNVVKALLDD